MDVWVPVFQMCSTGVWGPVQQVCVLQGLCTCVTVCSVGICVPVLQRGRGRCLQLLQALLEELLVLVDEVPLHLRHLRHDLLPAQPSHLRLPLALRLVLIAQRLQGVPAQSHTASLTFST